MIARYVVAPQAALDLFEIWDYLKEQTSIPVTCQKQREGRLL